MYLKKLKELRKNKNLTQNDVAKILEIKQEQYQRYESGKRDLPLNYLIKLSKFYNVTTDNILEINHQ